MTTSQTTPSSPAATASTPSASNLQGQYAGFISRLISMIIDIALVFVALIFTGLTVALIVQFFGLGDLLNSIAQFASQDRGILGWLFRLFTALGSFTFIFFFYYIVILTASAGMTVGHALMGVRVVRMDGKPITLTRSIRRYLMLWVAAIPLFLGFFWIIVDDRRQGWHDKLSDTCVIYDWPAREDENMLQGLSTRLAYLKEARRRGHEPAELPPAAEPAPTPETIT